MWIEEDYVFTQGSKEIRKKTDLAHRNEEEAYFLVILYFVIMLDASFLYFEPIYSCDVLCFNIISLVIIFLCLFIMISYEPMMTISAIMG